MNITDADQLGQRLANRDHLLELVVRVDECPILDVLTRCLHLLDQVVVAVHRVLLRIREFPLDQLPLPLQLLAFVLRLFAVSADQLRVLIHARLPKLEKLTSYSCKCPAARGFALLGRGLIWVAGRQTEPALGLGVRWRETFPVLGGDHAAGHGG